MVAYVLPGTVGYLGPVENLTPYSPPGSGLPGEGDTPPDCTWESYGLRCDDDSLTLDLVYIYGGIYFTGTDITITNSIVLAGTGEEFAAVRVTAGIGPITATDSTFGWLDGTMPEAVTDVAPITDGGTVTEGYLITRCDLSGSPQGLQPSANSQVIDCWIHDIVQNNPDGPNHLDGIFSGGGSDGTISGCYIDAPVVDTTAAVFFQDTDPPEGGDTTWSVEDCYLSGGAYTLYNETLIGLSVTNCVFGDFEYGNAINVADDGGTITLWTGNTDTDGAVVPNPAEVVTVTQAGSDASGICLATVVLTGAAATQPGQTAGETQDIPSLAITPQASGSLVYGAVLALADAFTALDSTTFLQNDAGQGLQYGAFVSADTTIGGTSVTVGSQPTGADAIAIAVAEILASGTLQQDASTPDPVQSGTTSAATAQFAPPAPCVILAIVTSNGGDGQTPVEVTDNSDLTWTELDGAQDGAGNGYAGIWLAQIGGGIPVVTAAVGGTAAMIAALRAAKVIAS